MMDDNTQIDKGELHCVDWCLRCVQKLADNVSMETSDGHVFLRYFILF